MYNYISKKFWTKEEDLVIISEFEKKSLHREVQKILPHRGLMAVRHRARYLGLNRRNSVNGAFFSKPDLINSYVAGFIASDGSIGSVEGRNSYETRWTLNKRDLEHLDLVARVVGFTGKPYCSNTRSEVTLSIRSQQWVQDLGKNFNIFPNKSLNLEPPELNAKNSLSYIVGYIDGDGSIMYRKDERPALGIVGTENILKWIRGLFNEISPPLKSSIGSVTKFKHSDAFHYNLSGRRVVDIIKTLHSINTPKLKRKWEGETIQKILSWEPKR